MGKLSVVVPDPLERKFRFAIAAMKNGKQGDLSDAVVEALEDWLKKREKAIARGTARATSRNQENRCRPNFHANKM
jgi:Arc/MetJ-type ribon-helix-helix transcriptional regulator